MSKTNVLQEWVGDLPWKMQSVLISGMRGPDTDNLPHIKTVTRWMRSVVQRDADPGHSFMNVATIQLPAPKHMEKEIEFCTIHFVSHFLYALQIIGYKHPDPNVTNAAYELYSGILVGDVLHFGVEAEHYLDNRLKDNV